MRRAARGLLLEVKGLALELEKAALELEKAVLVLEKGLGPARGPELVRRQADNRRQSHPSQLRRYENPPNAPTQKCFMLTAYCTGCKRFTGHGQAKAPLISITSSSTTSFDLRNENNRGKDERRDVGRRRGF